MSGGMKDLGPLVGAIDQGTGSTRFLVFAANTAELVTCELKCKPMLYSLPKLWGYVSVTEVFSVTT